MDGEFLHAMTLAALSGEVCYRCGHARHPDACVNVAPSVPPAIDDETRHRLILVCEYLETVGLMFVSPRVISSQIRAILEAGE